MKEGWEYKKYSWSDILTIINGKNQKNVQCEDGEYPIYGSGGIMGNANDYLCPENCTIIGRKGNINKPIYVETKFWNVDTAFGLLPNSDYLFPRYLFFFCLNYNFEKLNKAVTIPSLTKSDLLKIEIPLPPLSQQQSIVAELDKINEIIDLKKAQLKDLDLLAQSIFYDMFGDPIENPKGWEVVSFNSVGEFGRGVSKNRPRNAPELLGGTMPLIQTGEVTNSGMYITSYEQTYSELGVSQSKVWQPGTICITIAANIGKCSILTFEACFPDSVVGFVSNGKIENEYSYFVLCSLQEMLESNAPGAAQKNINLKVLNSLQIPLPPLSLQQSFAEKIQAIESQKSAIKQSLADVETLLASRMDYYFN